MWKPGKYLTIILWVTSIISALVCVYVFVQCGSLNERVPEERELMMSAINPLFIWSYILVVITLILALALPLPALVKNPKGLKGMVFGILGFGSVILVSWLLSSGDPLPFPQGHDPISEATIKFADLNLISMYVMFILTVIALIGSSIMTSIRNR